MWSVRGDRSRIATLWLVIWSASFAVAPALLTAAGHGDGQVSICTCPGDHAREACPMHQPGGAAKADTDICTMRSASDPTDAAWLSLAAGLGMPSTVAPLDVPPVSDRLASAVFAPADRAVLPDPPPPRI